jgi:drug/metabolite transporter (DMT)-like permease
VWGSTYYFILVALKGFPPFLLGALRFIIAGALMLGWCLIRKEKIFVKQDIKRSAISGFFLLFMGTGAVIWVEQFLESAYVAILISAAPIWFVLLDKRMWKENISNKKIMAGLVIGFAGIILLFGEKAKTIFYTSSNVVELSSLLILLVGMLSWCWGSLYSKHNPVSGSAVVNIGLQMFAAGIIFLSGCFLRGEFQQVQWHAIPAVQD